MPKPTMAKLISDDAPITFEQGAEVEGKVGPPTFNASPAYSGGPVSGATASPQLPHSYVIDLAGAKVPKAAKVNLDHKSNQRVGHITESVNDGKSLSLSGALSAKTSYRDEVAESAGSQYPWAVSIEGALSQRELIPAGKSATVNGRTVSGPMFVFRKSVISELAFVSRGADEGNAVTIAASAAKEQTMNEFDQYVAACGADPETISEPMRAALRVSFDAKQSAKSPSATTYDAKLAEIRKEQDRQEKIAEISLRAIQDKPFLRDQIDALTRAALADPSTDPVKFELGIVRMRPDAIVTGGAVQSTKLTETLREAALARAVGLDIENDRKYGPHICNLLEDQKKLYGNFSLQQMILSCAIQGGYNGGVAERIHNGNFGEVIRYAMGGFSNASLPGIIGNVANKQILAGYMEEDNTWEEFAAIKNVSNFYTQTHYRMLDSSVYEEVGSGGEIKHGTLGEESYTTQAKTYGKMFGLTRQQIINDDLSAFDDLRNRLGRGAARKFNDVFWASFMDNSSFFASGNNNYITGSTTNLGLDGVGLELGIIDLMTLTSPTADGSKRVGAGINGTKLLVPTELKFIAERLHQSTEIVPSAGNPNANIHAGKYRPIVQWRLSNSGYTGYSTTAWYLFGDNIKPMAVSFLNGNRTPTVESSEAEFNTLGMLWRGYHDFGCDKAEYAAGIKSKGAS